MFRFILLSLLTVPLLTGCGQIPTKQDYDEQANFSQIRSVQWLPASQQSRPSANEYKQRHPLLAQRIQSGIQKSLASKGIRLSLQTADAYVTYHVSKKTVLKQDPISIDFGFGHYGRYGGLIFHTQPDLYQAEEGQLVIDVYNTSGQLIWRGIGQALIEEQDTPQATTEYIHKVVNHVLSGFPPK